MKRILTLLSIILYGATGVSYGQKPTIHSVNRHHGAMKDIIILHGSDVGTSPANLTVRFGAVAGEIRDVSSHLIKVGVPPGATFSNIAVTNTSTGLTGFSPSP